MMRGIRGAVDAPGNTTEEILSVTRQLLLALQEANRFATEDVASVLFTATPDLDAEFPARAARELGWTGVPLLCAQEIAKSGAPARVIRVLIHVETSLRQEEVVHVYLGETACLRPDIKGKRP